MLQKATRLMAEKIPRDRWRDVTVRVTSSALEMFRDSVSSSNRFITGPPTGPVLCCTLVSVVCLSVVCRQPQRKRCYADFLKVPLNKNEGRKPQISPNFASNRDILSTTICDVEEK